MVKGTILDLSKAFGFRNDESFCYENLIIAFDEHDTNSLEICLSKTTQTVVLRAIQADLISLKKGVP